MKTDTIAANLIITYIFGEGFHREPEMIEIAWAYGFHYDIGHLIAGKDEHAEMGRSLTFNGDCFAILPGAGQTREDYEREMTMIFRDAIGIEMHVFLTDHRI